MNERKQTSVKQLQRVHFSKSKKINTFIQWLNSKRIKTIQTKTPITLVSVVYKNALQRFNERKQHSLKVDSFKIMRNNHKQLIYAKQIKHLATKKQQKREENISLSWPNDTPENTVCSKYAKWSLR